MPYYHWRMRYGWVKKAVRVRHGFRGFVRD